jgi:GMP synthase (glutamine-hydrolysing)
MCSKRPKIQQHSPDTIVILDFGGQYAHLIARKVREQNVYSEILPCSVTAQEIEEMMRRLDVKGLIFSGGPMSVYRHNAPEFDIKILSLPTPILGICYGHQLIAHMVGGRVVQGERGEYGVTFVTVDNPNRLLRGLEKVERVWMSHTDTVYKLPEDYEVLAHSDSTPVAAFRHRTKHIYGLQWHPEVVHTDKGVAVLRNFIFDICGCEPNWVVEDLLEKMIEEVQRTVGESKAIVALSGGVDSSVAAAIASRAIGKRLTAVFIDHGFMRDGEPEAVKAIFEKFDMNFIILNERERFLTRLRGVTDPEEKRRVIGEEFVKSFERVAQHIGAEYLVQGTIYPDRIESGFKKYSEKIKTHHNVAGFPSTSLFKAIIEPLRDLYKDEVRQIAGRIGLPREVYTRQPFPGPGLAVRIMGEVTSEKLDILRKADRIVDEEFKKWGLQGLWQHFVVLTDTRSTGVKGDARIYGYTLAIRAVESTDGMTANFAKLPYDLLEKASLRLANEIQQVCRVVYDITHKPPATIEWE